MQPITVLLNPRAGSRNAPSADDLAGAFRAAQCDADIRIIDGPSIAAAATDALQRGSRVLAAAGGDGTVSAVASVVAETGATLGVIPLGTLNHFAKDLDIPLDLGEAAKVMATGRRVSVDLGELNGRPFINHASIGMYASLVAERDAMQRLGRGKWLAHGLAAMRVWRHYRRFRVDVRRSTGEVGNKFEVVRTPFVFVGNNEFDVREASVT